ncbi:Os10g0542750, partial [Oryza sativa Japonica Group]
IVESKCGREQVEQRHPGIDERAVHLLAAALGGGDALLEATHPRHGRLPLLLLLVAVVLEGDGPPPPEEVGHQPHGAGRRAGGGVGRRCPWRRRGARRGLGGGGRHAGEDGGGRGRHGGGGGREGVGEGGLVGVVSRGGTVGEVARGGGEPGDLPRRAPLRAQRRGEARPVAAPERGVGLGEELPERDERLPEAAVEVGEEEEVVEQLLRPRPPQRVLRLRVVEQVGEPGEHLPRPVRPVRHPGRPRLRRCVRPLEQRPRRVVQAGDERVEADGQA